MCLLNCFSIHLSQQLRHKKLDFSLVNNSSILGSKLGFFNSGLIVATFQDVANSPSVSEMLIMSAICSIISGDTSLKTLAGIGSPSHALAYMLSTISCTSSTARLLN